MAQADRDAARRVLAHVIMPTEALIHVKGSPVEFIALLDTAEKMMAIAEPLSRALVHRLEPWLAESRRRRQDLIGEIRAIDTARRAKRGPVTVKSPVTGEG